MKNFSSLQVQNTSSPSLGYHTLFVNQASPKMKFLGAIYLYPQFLLFHLQLNLLIAISLTSVLSEEAEETEVDLSFSVIHATSLSPTHILTASSDQKKKI